MKVKNLLNKIHEGLKVLEDSFCLYCLEAKFRSMETKEARMFRIWTEDIEAIPSDAKH